MADNDHVAWLLINGKNVLMGNINGATSSGVVQNCFPVCIPIRENDIISFEASGTDIWGAYLCIYGTI